jgi:hypothetical protein
MRTTLFASALALIGLIMISTAPASPTTDRASDELAVEVRTVEFKSSGELKVPSSGVSGGIEAFNAALKPDAKELSSIAVDVTAGAPFSCRATIGGKSYALSGKLSRPDTKGEYYRVSINYIEKSGTTEVNKTQSRTALMLRINEPQVIGGMIGGNGLDFGIIATLKPRIAPEP